MHCKNVAMVSRDTLLARTLQTTFAGEGFNVIMVADVSALPLETTSAIILESDSPEEPRLYQKLHQGPHVPILALVSGGDVERVSALRAGADDCMTRPVNTDELAARIRKLIARVGPEDAGLPHEARPITVNNLCIDPVGYRVRVGERDVALTLREFNLLLVLASRKGKVVSRQELIDRVWGDCHLDSDRTIDVHICRLRRKIEPDSLRPGRLVLVRGLGYKLER